MEFSGQELLVHDQMEGKMNEDAVSRVSSMSSAVTIVSFEADERSAKQEDEVVKHNFADTRQRKGKRCSSMLKRISGDVEARTGMSTIASPRQTMISNSKSSSCRSFLGTSSLRVSRIPRASESTRSLSEAHTINEKKNCIEKRCVSGVVTPAKPPMSPRSQSESTSGLSLRQEREFLSNAINF